MLTLYERGKAGGFVYVREVVHELGIPEKRAAAICYKWQKRNKDWYEYGVNILAGWLTDKGKAEAERLRAQDQSDGRGFFGATP
jgi:hypothetical protein